MRPEFAHVIRRCWMPSRFGIHLPHFASGEELQMPAGSGPIIATYIKSLGVSKEPFKKTKTRLLEVFDSAGMDSYGQPYSNAGLFTLATVRLGTSNY